METKKSAELSASIDRAQAKVRTRALSRNATVERTGDKVILPDGVDLRKVDAFIHKEIEAEEQPQVEVHRYKCHWQDGLVGLMDVLEETFGKVNIGEWLKPGLFGSTKEPPQMIDIQVGWHPDGKPLMRSLPMLGKLTVPGLPGVSFESGTNGTFGFYIKAAGLRKDMRGVIEILNAIESYVAENSIFRGNSVDSQFNWMNVSRADWGKLAFNFKTKQLIEANLFNPVRYYTRLHEVNASLKRGVLLYGSYGTGKTESAHALAKEANDLGITFIYVLPDHYQNLSDVLVMARQYSPAILFFEDIDAVAQLDDDRNHNVNKLLNEIDGITAKQGAEVMVVCTTNRVDDIEPGLMRPGRLDAVIEIDLPDATTAADLIEIYGGSALAPDFDFDRAGKHCAGIVPAFIAESVRRAGLFALPHTPPGKAVRIKTDDVIISVETMRAQMQFAAYREPEKDTAIDKAIGSIVQDIVTSTLSRSIVDPENNKFKVVVEENV